jgi:hypothetical protein
VADEDRRARAEAQRLFARPPGYPQHKRISYFQQSIWVAPPARPGGTASLSGTGEFFHLVNDSGTDLRAVEIRLAPCGALWNSYVSNASSLAGAGVRVVADEGSVLIEVDMLPADASFEVTIVTEGLTPNWDRLESTNEKAILVPLNSRRIGMDADRSER